LSGLQVFQQKQSTKIFWSQSPVMLKTINLTDKAFLGQILIRKRLISESELERALLEQQRSAKKLGEILL